jgi:phosphonate transport system substrate-binding protein
MGDATLIMGAVAYAPKVVTIWEGFKAFFGQNGLAFDYVLFSNYERQVEAQFDGTLHLAWNSPLAWIRADRMARTRGRTVRAVAMRWDDPQVRPLLELEGLREWRAGRTSGYAALERAVDDEGF